MSNYSTKVTVHGYATNNTNPPEPMIHIIGNKCGEPHSLCFTPEDARKVAAIMIQFTYAVEAANDIEWAL